MKISKFTILLLCFFASPLKAAVLFNSISDYVSALSAPSTDNWSTTGESITLWVNCNVTPIGYTRIIEKGANSVWQITWSNGSLGYVNAGVTNGTNRVTSLNTLNDGKWHFLAVTISTNFLVTLYVDNVYQNALTGITPIYTGTIYLNQYAGGGYGTTQILDDVRVYKRILSQSEISTLSLSRSRYVITDGLALWLKFDEGTFGNTAAKYLDSSPNQLQGNFAGSPTWTGGILNYSN